MTDWREISTNEYILFLNDWKTREEISKQFNLSPVSSWHCCKFLSKLSEVETVKGYGFTKRTIKYKARRFALEKIAYEENVIKISKPHTTNEDLKFSQPKSTE